ncbi:MAG: calcium/proton exchanger [Gemmatimonadaceae bacterium]
MPFLLLLLVPASLIVAYGTHAPPLWTFVISIVAIIPLAEWIRRATEELARVVGGSIGGLLNVTFGNAAELILALFILQAGHQDVVKAQITGSIIGNSLLGLGLAIVFGSWGRERQTFRQAHAGQLASLLILSVIALIVPALFDLTERGLYRDLDPRILNERLSIGASVILITLYIANLIYTLVTHRDVFDLDEDDPDVVPAKATSSVSVKKVEKAVVGAAHPPWPLWRSLAVLIGATAFISWEAELVSGALEPAAVTLGLSTFFLGIVPLAVIGNAAEYLSAISFARQNRMGVVMTITVGSSIQVALFTAPVLVLASHMLGHPMTLVFNNPLELIAVAAAAFTVNAVSRDGETTWFEGVLLLGVYALLGLAFFFVAPAGH